MLDSFQLVTNPLRTIDQTQRDYLVKLTDKADIVALVEEHIRSTRIRYFLLAIPSFILFAAGAIIALSQIFKLHNSHEVWIATAALYVAEFLLLYPVIRSSPEYWTFQALTAGLSKVDKAIGSSPASSSRKKLARDILSSSRKMQSYRPLIPVRLHARIQSREAIRAGRALRQLVYPVMLGTDEDLVQVKEALAGAALRVGTTRWVEIGDLKGYSDIRSTHRNFTFTLLLPWLVGVVIPLTTALIAALTKSPK